MSKGCKARLFSRPVRREIKRRAYALGQVAAASAEAWLSQRMASKFPDDADGTLTMGAVLAELDGCTLDDWIDAQCELRDVDGF